MNYLKPKINLNSLSASLISFAYTICFANFLWIHYLLRGLTSNPLFFSWYQYACSIFFAIALAIHHIFRKDNLFREFSMDLLSPSRLLFELILFFRIHYLFCEFTLNPRSFSLWPHHEITVNSLFVSKIHLEFIFFAKSLRILPLNSLYFSWFHYEFTIFSQNNFEYIFLFVNSS